VRVGSEIKLVTGALFALSPSLGISAELAGATASSAPFERATTPLEGMLGIRNTLGSIALSLGAGAGLSSGYGTPDARLLAALALPLAAAPAGHAAASDPDGDRDGVLGAADECPAEPEDKDGFRDHDGCPELDDDRDGIADTADRCRFEPEDKDDFEDDDGCPELDDDRDGITDAADRCRLEAEDKDGFEDDDGCPELDNDQDGFEDAKDACPREPESKNGVDDEDGCPDFARVEQGQIRTLEPIFFEVGTAKIQARSEPLLAEMAHLIAERKDLGVVSIEGHTDSKAGDDFNQRLSEARAQAVRDFLVRLGVADDRLVARGFGESRPIAENTTPAGRARNRRVEFRFDAGLGEGAGEQP
jgi:outer membrane protein OmpA-like peptidoglycan-associated protein